jgi:hypothetical protein
MAKSESDAVFDQVRDEYMERIFQEIRADAQKRCGGAELKAVDAFRAFEDYFARMPARDRAGAAGFLQDHVFLLSAIFLTLVFGAFGLYHGDETEVASFLDIAKIFAGAVVGGAAGSSVASMTRRKAGPGGK